MPDNTTASVDLFPVSYTIGTGLPGAPLLTLDLLVNAANSTVRGSATISQTTNPPISVHSDVWGTYTYLGLQPPEDSRILLSIQGSPGGPLSGLPENFQLHALLENNWSSGIASYRYANGGAWREVGTVPVKQKAAAKPISTLEGHTNPVIVPLYAAALHGARATGNLAQMKELAAQAQQRLDSEAQIRDALTELQEQLAKLESR